jgi:hypothetical protein
VAGSAIRTRCAGHTDRGPETRHALRMNPDHPIGAGQRTGLITRPERSPGRRSSDRPFAELRPDR